MLDSCGGVTPTDAVITEVVDATSEIESQVMLWLADCLRRCIARGGKRQKRRPKAAFSSKGT